MSEESEPPGKYCSRADRRRDGARPQPDPKLSPYFRPTSLDKWLGKDRHGHDYIGQPDPTTGEVARDDIDDPGPDGKDEDYVFPCAFMDAGKAYRGITAAQRLMELLDAVEEGGQR